MKNKLVLVLIILIGLLAGIFRIYKLDKIPPSLNWDEVAASYNAYTIETWGKDEYGKTLPTTFKSFGDDKHPVHIYAAATSFFLLGASDFTARLPSALIGILGVVSIFIAVTYLLDNKIAGLFSALFLAVSPYAVHYSRGLWEANFAICFFLMGLAMFALGIKKKRRAIPFAYLFWGLSLLSYHASKVVVPPLVMLITILFVRELLKIKKVMFLSFLIFASFIILLIAKPGLLGLARISQTDFPKEVVQNTFLYEKTHIELLGRIEVSLGNFKNYFSYDYLFKYGDQGPRGSVRVIGEYYKSYILFLPLGILFLLYKKKFRVVTYILAWTCLAPMPGALAGVEPHSTRAIFMLGPFEIIAGYGVSSLLGLFKNRIVKIGITLVILVALGYEVYGYAKYYLTNYSVNEAIQWQYGFKEIVEYVGQHPEYDQVYVTKIRNQPYIFFLNYLHYPLTKLLSTVRYDETGSKSYNTVESFGRYHFGDWDPIQSLPTPGYLYIISKNEYQGLMYGYMFETKKIIYFPNGEPEYYIVSIY
jgi:hypothetical protein